MATIDSPAAAAADAGASTPRSARDICASYRPLQSRSVRLSSNMHRVPRSSCWLYMELVCLVLRHFVRLELADAAGVASLRDRFHRMDGWLFHLPSGTRCSAAGVEGVAAEWVQAG